MLFWKVLLQPIATPVTTNPGLLYHLNIYQYYNKAVLERSKKKRYTILIHT